MQNELFNILDKNKKDIQMYFSDGLLTINSYTGNKNEQNKNEQNKNKQNKNTIRCLGLLVCENCPFYFESTEFTMFSCNDDTTQNIIIDYIKKELPEILL